jgi:hypothetical protein
MPTQRFTVTVTWNGSQVLVNPDPVPAYQGRSDHAAQITWQPSNGTFGSNAFSFKPGSSGITVTSSGANLVSEVFDPNNFENLFYNITITDSNGVPHTLDPEIENIPPGGGVKPGKPPVQPDVQPGQPGGGQPGGGDEGGGQSGAGGQGGGNQGGGN